MFLKHKIIFFFVFIFSFGYSQEVKTLHYSGFKHNYVVGSLEYIEEIKDTSRLKYIATIQIEAKTYNWTGIVIHWLDRIQTEARALGANTICIENYLSRDSSATLTVKVFFASLNFLKENKLKQNKGNIFLFSSFCDMKEDSIYINKVRLDIDPKKFYMYKAEVSKEYFLAVNKKIIPTKVRFKNEKQVSKYFIVPYRKGSVSTDKLGSNPSSALGKTALPQSKNSEIKVIPLVRPGFVGVTIMGVAAAGLLLNLGKNNPVELDYRDGRFMTDIFK